MGDVASWFDWDGRVTPISIDLAVDEVHGDVLMGALLVNVHCGKVEPG